MMNNFCEEHVQQGEYCYATDEEHFDNNQTMDEFLKYELTDDFDINVADGTYAEITSVNTGKRYAVHAGGLGDCFNHRINFQSLN